MALCASGVSQKCGEEFPPVVSVCYLLSRQVGFGQCHVVWGNGPGFSFFSSHGIDWLS